MVFVETPIFTRQVQHLLSDDQYRDLQDELRSGPDAGSKIRGSGGLRKLRWATEGQGKSGGVRVIYYWIVAQDRIFMVYMYPKSRQADLSPEQLKVLRKTVEEELS
ncbi:MAG: type II toxin-antitoxin system RelE/ParE family toxin [Desulfomonilaceae bacterium]|nr:type II toxin-antitoxin system RelE/ParE family toxin [Desulfomonilaceae bacterium]